MTSLALELFVFALQFEAGFRVVEGFAIQLDDGVVTPFVFNVALCARFVGVFRVVPDVFLDIQRDPVVALQTLLVRHAFAELVTKGTVGDAFVLGVDFVKGPRRDPLLGSSCCSEEQ